MVYQTFLSFVNRYKSNNTHHSIQNKRQELKLPHQYDRSRSTHKDLPSDLKSCTINSTYLRKGYANG